MTDTFEWQGRVGETWAAEWQRTDRSLAPVQAELLERIGGLEPWAAGILDIGCGAGTTTISAAARFPHAKCLGVDLSPALIDTALSRAATANCRFGVADASTWSDPAFRPDTLISRHGVMFFDDPVAAFARLGESATPDVRLIFSCFRASGENAWATDMMALLPEQPGGDPLAPGPFAFAGPDHVAGILATAGWKDARPAPFDWDYVAGAGDNAVADALSFFQQIGPAARAARTLTGQARADFIARLERLLQSRLADGRVTFKAAGWIWTAHR